MSCTLTLVARTDAAWMEPSASPRSYTSFLKSLYERGDSTEINETDYETLMTLQERESSFYPEETLPLMAIKAPLNLVQKAVTLQKQMIEADSSSSVTQKKWDLYLKFNWMDLAVLFNPTLEVLQFLQSKGCKLSSNSRSFLGTRAPIDASLFQMQDFMKRSDRDDVIPFFAKSYPEDVCKFIYENLVH